MHPIRSRPDGSLRIAVACPHEGNEGCSKGYKATQEVERIVSALQGQDVSAQAGLFD